MMAARIDIQKIRELKYIDSDTTYKGIGTENAERKNRLQLSASFLST